MKDFIIVEPFGGLGNRMRVLVSAIRLSCQLHKELKIVWKTGEDFNCEYHKLFKPNLFFTVVEKDSEIKVLSSFNNSPIKKPFISLINKLKGLDLVICEQDLNQTFFKKNFEITTLSGYSNIYIRSCEQFYGGNEWSIFVPSDEIQQKIEKMMMLFTGQIIGVHIRRTDNGKSIKYSPLEAFIEKMNQEIKNPDIKFFIATDDRRTLNELILKFSERKVLHYDKEFSRSLEKGIQDALIDLICLSRCRKIIGSYWSSFTEVASFLQGAELEVVKTNSPDH